MIQAATGTANLLSRVDGNPVPRFLPSLIADKVSGLHGTWAVMAAIIHKLRFGEGQFVEVPMFESFTHFMMQEHLYGQALVPPREPAGYPRQLDPFRQPFPAKDGWVVIVPYTPDAIDTVIELLEAPELAKDPRFIDYPSRMRNISEFYEEMAKRTPKLTMAEWAAKMAKHQIPAMPVRDLDDVTSDPHLQAVDFFQKRTQVVERERGEDAAALARLAAARRREKRRNGEHERAAAGAAHRRRDVVRVVDVLALARARARRAGDGAHRPAAARPPGPQANQRAVQPRAVRRQQLAIFVVHGRRLRVGRDVERGGGQRRAGARRAQRAAQQQKLARSARGRRRP